MIKVSIIITCHNLERYIVRAISSCIHQDFPYDQYEIIIIDDASTDNSRDSILLYENFAGYNFIKLKFLEENRGVAHASNVGISMARGKYIVRVDGDDYIHREFLRTMSEVLEWNPDLGFVYCDLIIVEEPNIKKKMQRNTFERLLNHGAGVMFRKKHLRSLDGYNEQLRNCEDYDLILRYSEKYPGYHLRLPYYRYFKMQTGLGSKQSERKHLKKKIRKAHTSDTGKTS